MKHIYKLNLGFCPLSDFEMLQIRGGAEVPKPKTKPRDVFDEEFAAVSQQGTTSFNEASIFTYLLNWLKK